MITHESLSIDEPHPSVLRVHYVQIDKGIDMGGKLVISRENIARLAAELLAACDPQYAPVELQLGLDHLRFYQSGPDQQSFVNVLCRRPAAAPFPGLSGLMLTIPYARQLARLLRPPGYVTEDLDLHIIAGPPRYTSRTDKPVEYITLQTTAGEPIGHIYANDDDNAAGFVPHPASTPEGRNTAAFWIQILHDSRLQGWKPSLALDRMCQTIHDRSRVIPGSRATAPSLEALTGPPPPAAAPTRNRLQ